MRLPQPDDEGDKEERGRVLVVGGAREMPGAVILAATAALRAGAGKLQIATARSIAPLVAMSIPEARVFALPETRAGAIHISAAALLSGRAESAQAVVVGPGMLDEEAVSRLLKRLLARITKTAFVVDAGALASLADDETLLHSLGGRAVITPHAGEMSRITGISKDTIERDPFAHALLAAKRYRAVVALKGRETIIAAPGGETYCNRAGNVGLATSGSGDVLSGLIAGLAARGATPLQAAVWGVHLHARAGDRLAQTIGPLGYLARELLNEIPALMSQLN
ncbi:MAG TPA: NAD(P)H-hydrate dehydratase [Pyrinomonadaceae bacterium]|nr:NAD(P)H-hydrate dehydratase [Pyrinomonadaceae bacterium]